MSTKGESFKYLTPEQQEVIEAVRTAFKQFLQEYKITQEETAQLVYDKFKNSDEYQAVLQAYAAKVSDLKVQKSMSDVWYGQWIKREYRDAVQRLAGLKISEETPTETNPPPTPVETPSTSSTTAGAAPTATTTTTPSPNEPVIVEPTGKPVEEGDVVMRVSTPKIGVQPEAPEVMAVANTAESGPAEEARGNPSASSPGGGPPLNVAVGENEDSMARSRTAYSSATSGGPPVAGYPYAHPPELIDTHGLPLRRRRPNEGAWTGAKRPRYPNIHRPFGNNTRATIVGNRSRITRMNTLGYDQDIVRSHPVPPLIPPHASLGQRGAPEVVSGIRALQPGTHHWLFG